MSHKNQDCQTAMEIVQTSLISSVHITENTPKHTYKLGKAVDHLDTGG